LRWIGSTVPNPRQVDAASLVQIPLKLEIAYPVGDSEYKSPQFIFFGVLTGS
jgi:hypothetical protein